jgi:uracil-DNA glycosylase family 4
VPGSGKVPPKLMFVGEGPGRQEDLAGEPFVGAAGKMLDSMLKGAGISREEVFITNIVKCRPPGNRKPMRDEIETCTSNYLEKQIALFQPKLICTLGSTALEYFTGEKKMGVLRGKLTRSKDGLEIFPTYHPAAVFRNRTLRSVLDSDIKKIPSILAKLDH